MSKLQLDASVPAKELRKEAAKRIAAKVTNREGFEEALKLRFALLEKVAALKDAAKCLAAQADELGALASGYAQEAKTALDEPLAEKQEGVVSGAVTLEGFTYRLTLSKDKMKRISGANMTAAFLSSLPKKWTKQKLELDATAINNLGVSDADLAEHDLVRPGKAVWSRKEEGANDE